MTKKELIKKIAEAKHASITKTTEFYHTFEKTLSEAITSHAEVILSPQIGKFVLKAKKAYFGKNPQTGQKLKIPAKTVVTFKLSKTIKGQVKALILK
ncbi:HU family DNA-binding protein [Candidatus Phytoplasma australasiaticum]|nr:HU family DNA-binding protein [Candidatus Phytoplasma australasiaticum]MDO8058990.1 HU family DNA-binding protein [Candidatus Phytoplasma australasiaticum]